MHNDNFKGLGWDVRNSTEGIYITYTAPKQNWKFVANNTAFTNTTPKIPWNSIKNPYLIFYIKNPKSVVVQHKSG